MRPRVQSKIPYDPLELGDAGGVAFGVFDAGAPCVLVARPPLFVRRVDVVCPVDGAIGAAVGNASGVVVVTLSVALARSASFAASFAMGESDDATFAAARGLSVCVGFVEVALAAAPAPSSLWRDIPR